MTRIRPALACAALLLALAAAPLHGQWRVTVGTGGAYNLPLPLHIQQSGSPELSLDAHWSTRPLDPPLYYVARVEKVKRRTSIGVEWIHHKLFLEDPPAEVQRFAISHGFNLVTVLRGWLWPRGWSARVGGGWVIAHPETTVRDRAQPDGGPGDLGYYLAGPTLQLGGGWARPVASRTWVGVEAKAIGAWASVPISAGNASLWHASGHLDVVVSQGF